MLLAGDLDLEVRRIDQERLLVVEERLSRRAG